MRKYFLLYINNSATNKISKKFKKLQNLPEIYENIKSQS